MKILLGLANEYVVEELQKLGTDEKIDIAETTESFYSFLPNQYDLIVASINLFKEVYPWSWMTDIREANPDAKIQIILTEEYDSFYLNVAQRLCLDLEFKVLPLGLTEKELIDSLAFTIFGKKEYIKPTNGKVFTFISASSKDGATSLAINTALMIAENTELKVCILDLNLKCPDVVNYMKLTNGKSLNSLLPNLYVMDLEPQNLLTACSKYKGLSNLYVLTGNNRRDTAEDIKVEHIKSLLEVAKTAFDVVIVDVHTFPDNSATYCAVKDADERFIVTQPIILSYGSSWRDWYNNFWKHTGLTNESFGLIINRVGQSDMYSTRDITSETKINLIGTISNVGNGAGITAANEGVPMYVTQGEESEFVSQLRVIAQYITEKLGVNLKEEAPKKQSVLSKILTFKK